MKMYELSPVASQKVKSFYGKAKVVLDGNTETLYSYDTPIVRKEADGKIVRLWGNWSLTTGRHVFAFCGLDKKGYDALPMA